MEGSSTESDRSSPLDMALEDAIDEVKRITQLFLCNHFHEAMAEVDGKLDKHFYMYVLQAIFKSLNGIVTFQDDTINEAVEAIHAALAVVSQHRRKRGTISKYIWTPNYDDWTDIEVHAEGSYSVLSAMAAVMSIAHEKSILGLFKAGYWGKTAYSVLSECRSISKKRTSYSSDKSKETVVHGVEMGLGLLNLVLSLLPARILRLLQFLGFSGKKGYALDKLLLVARGQSMWAPISAQAFLGYHCVLEFFIGLGFTDMETVTDLLVDYDKRYPDSGFFVMYEALIQQINGKPDKAITLFVKSSDKFSNWKEWQNTCHWMIIWCHAVQSDWRNALKHTKILLEDCSWSKCVFAYQFAAILKMIAEEATDPEEKAALDREIDHYLEVAPTYKRSFAGKTVFVEKFVTKRCQIYWEDRKVKDVVGPRLDGNGNPVSNDDSSFLLPILELFLFWNIFQTIKGKEKFIQVFLDKIESRLPDYPFDEDNKEYHLFLILMKGICHKYMSSEEKALESLTFVLHHEDLLKLYIHLAPLACLELGFLYFERKDYSRADKYLVKAMNDYSHYLNETLVHIRAHAVLSAIKEEKELVITKKMARMQSCP